MQTRLKKWLIAVAGVILLIVLGLWLTIELRWKRTFDAPYPDIRATSDPAVVARGQYLLFGPAACAYCHVPREEWARLDEGATPPLAGNHVFELPFGEFLSPNLTPDPETGIGARTDGELARILRHGVRADGRAAFPFMEYQGLSDEDLTAIISYLRAQPPVGNRVSGHRLNLLGKALMAFLIEPVSAQAVPPVSTPLKRGPSVESGHYLANHVSMCVACHTDRSRTDGSFIGAPFAGGQKMDVAEDSTIFFVPPNLTPHPETSPIGRWTEEEFVGRFLSGESTPGTPMPWGAYARMSVDDMRSLYRYLRSLEPVENDTGPVVQPRE